MKITLCGTPLAWVITVYVLTPLMAAFIFQDSVLTKPLAYGAAFIAIGCVITEIILKLIGRLDPIAFEITVERYREEDEEVEGKDK